LNFRLLSEQINQCTSINLQRSNLPTCNLQLKIMKKITLLAITAILLAWSFDLLFWQKEPGISFALFILLCLVAGIILTWQEGLRPALSSLALLPPVLLFAAITFLRQEPFTRAASAGLALAGTTCSRSPAGRALRQYSLVDYLVNGLHWAGNTLAHPMRCSRRPGAAGVRSRRRRSSRVSLRPPTAAHRLARSWPCCSACY
jgi:hypothetical protein